MSSGGSLLGQKIYLNRQTELSELYEHPADTVLAYPPTTSSKDQYIGHILLLEPDRWRNIVSEIQYSLGDPRGQCSNVFVGPLKDDSGQPVPCIKKYATCQGIKICPYLDTSILSLGHTAATDETFQTYRTLLPVSAEISPQRDIHERTLALWATFRDYGCQAALNEITEYALEDYLQHRETLQTPLKATRGHNGKVTCKGHLQLINIHTNLVVRCEHYNAERSRMHVNFYVSSASHDLTYFRALFNAETETLLRLETDMKKNGYGPLTPCSVVRNCTSTRVNCDIQHRSLDGSMVMTELTRLPCTSVITIYEPLPAYRNLCPKVLLVCNGAHSHPIPIPARTPQNIRDKLIMFLTRLDDLPNLTSRKLITHESAKLFLRNELPHRAEPSFVDLHPSLGNLDHLQVYINKAISSVHPHGTGWQGILHLKAAHDSKLPPAHRYIRYAEEVRLSRQATEDTQLLGQVNDPDIFRLIICVKSENSLRLVHDARHIQSDISFKRVSGWLEFELGGFDRVNQCAVVYARAYLNRQTAEAHEIMLLEINRIVKLDTGFSIPFRHLHAANKDDIDFKGILSWTVDQHRGQAKGIGQFLQAISPANKPDLYEGHRNLTELGPYEHLQRILRLCFAHYGRNIQKSQVSPQVKDAMFSLAGTIHKDGTQASWNTTLDFIRTEGKKSGQDWLQDKIDSKFALPALCWQVTQRIPLEVWQASDETSNVIEALHQDQLRDGMGLTLLGGVLRGQQYDTMRLQLFQNWQEHGITTRYQPSTPAAQAYRTVARNLSSKKRQYDREDVRIEEQNTKLRKVASNLEDAREREREVTRKVASGQWSEERLEQAKARVRKLEGQYDKQRAEGSKLKVAGIGSGKVKPLD